MRTKRKRKRVNLSLSLATYNALARLTKQCDFRSVTSLVKAWALMMVQECGSRKIEGAETAKEVAEMFETMTNYEAPQYGRRCRRIPFKSVNDHETDKAQEA